MWAVGLDDIQPSSKSNPTHKTPLLTHKQIYVKSLKAQESLAYVDVVLTDKTGTLTENRLALSAVLLPSSVVSPSYLEGMYVCVVVCALMRVYNTKAVDDHVPTN